LQLTKSNRYWIFFVFSGLSLLLSGCGQATITAAPPAPTAEQTLEATPAAVPTSTLTPTPPPPQERIIFYPAGGADEGLAARIEPILTEASIQAGLTLETRNTLLPDMIDEGVKLVAVTGGGAVLLDLVQAAPGVPFLVIGSSGLSAGENLSLFELQGESPDYISFMAGYIAAIVTPDWRVGMIGVEDEEEGARLRQGFTNGSIFFCGLCRQVYPHFTTQKAAYIRYPLYRGIRAGAGAAEWLEAADYLISRGTTTIYLAAEPADPTLLDYLAESGVKVLAGFAPPAGNSSNWIATLRSRLDESLGAAISAILEGDEQQAPPTPIVFEHINQENFSLGRQRLAEKTREDLLLGFISTGVE
jgi:hypothetical protein